MKFGSLFSGIGGIDLGLERAGMEAAWQCEANERAQNVLRYHWPNVKLFDDVRTINKGENACESVELICGGFPCQDLSVAGNRRGLAGERSGLFYEFIRLASELAPSWLLFENVPGLLSSNEGRDMGAVLTALGDLGYWWAYRVLDAQYFGLAQRRRRVFIVASSRADRSSAARVLFEAGASNLDSPTRSEEGHCPSGELAYCLTSSGASGYDVAAQQGNLVFSPANLQWGRGAEPRYELAGTIDAHAHKSPAHAHHVQQSERPNALRRLTPLECERLQGFPDYWTLQSATGPQKDRWRYFQLGNAVAVNVAEWIGKRIVAVERGEL